MGELLFTGLILLGAVILLISSFSIQIVDDYFGARYWPMFLLVICVILLTAKIIKALSALAPEKRKWPLTAETFQSPGVKRLLLAFLFCTLYVLAVSRTGFLPATFLLGASISWLLGAGKLRQMSIAGFCASVPIFAAFVWVLHLHLPRGIGMFYNFSTWLEGLL